MHMKHKKKKTTKTVRRGEGGYQYRKTFREAQGESNIRFEQQSVKTFRDAQGEELSVVLW